MTSITNPRSLPLARPQAAADALLVRVRGTSWVVAAHVAVTAIAAVLYLVNLTVSGFANTYYSAAALAASQSWSAWFFGSIDAANFITVDKPPLATMLMGLSVRLFGLSSWSILLPEALAGVATVAVLFVIVRRSFGPVAATIAGLVMAFTPVAVLIFRYDNPDALLTLLLVLAAGAFLRALEAGRLRWLIVAAVFVGLAFNTKYLQAYLVLPAFVLVYAFAAPGGIRRRAAGLLVAGVAVLISSGWWVLIVELIPTNMRPYIGGSQTDSAVQLLLGYDGLGRIFGSGGGGPGGGGGGGGGFSGTPGLLRLFNAEFGGQISWLLPFSIVGLVTGLLVRGRASRTDSKRAAYLLWGGWLAVHALVFSLMSGIIHSYYAVALAPAIAALVGAGVVELWGLRSRFWFGGVALAAAILGSAVWAWALLERTPTFAPGLGTIVVLVGVLTAAVVGLPASLSLRRVPLLAAGLGLAMLLAGPAAYAASTMATAYGGGDPSAGPAVASDGGRGGFGGFGGGNGGPTGRGGPGAPAAGAGPGVSTGTAPAGGVTGDSSSTSALVSYLLANRGDTTWIVAATSANQAGALELASGAPVMAMGGFSGSDPAPTLAEFQAYVASGQVRYVLIGGGGGPGGGGFGGGGRGVFGGGSSTVSQINEWAASVGTVVTINGASGTLYDLSALVTGGS